MKTIRIAARLAIVAAAAGLSACGSSSSSSSSTPTASGLSQAELATKANAICATAQAQASKLTVPSGATLASDAVAAAAYFDKLFPITDKETKDIQALTPAAAAASVWQTFVTAQVAADQLLQTIKQKADAKDPSGLADLAKVQPAGQVVAAAATKVGAGTCANG
jgi:hypothetical protein